MSYVLSGKRAISTPTKKRAEEAIARLDFPVMMEIAISVTGGTPVRLRRPAAHQ